jgi:hypothetical protein
MEQPRIAGVAGGVGTTVLAHALRARDEELYGGGPVDILVCRSTTASLGDAHRAVAMAPGKPILAVVADVPAVFRIPAFTRPTEVRMRMVEEHVTAMIAVPFVLEWRAKDDPYSDAAWVLEPTSQLPRYLTDFADAAERLSKAVQTLLSPVPVPSGPGPATARDRRLDPDEVPALFPDDDRARPVAAAR